ncbi:hypothetical protein AB0G60_03790 [Streptomyces angustmyceticus]|nr:hypothetical protein [Streptomyces angustmyceticus]UAL65770.1 hypothetical protein K7396_03755 [Streptomyces angustmyceticus]
MTGPSGWWTARFTLRVIERAMSVMERISQLRLHAYELSPQAVELTLHE